MNGEQLQDFLTDLSRTTIRPGGRDDVEVTRKFLAKWANNTMLLANYITVNYRDVDLVQPLFAQILALYYKGGILRQYALQFIPSFIGTYLYALSKKQQKSVAVFEIFFLAVYNEEILDGGPQSENMTKKHWSIEERERAYEVLRKSILRQYALQFIPSFIGTYLYALSKKQQKSVAVFEIFFLAVYNEEILDGGPQSENMTKKVDEIRIPSIRYPSIYHDPTKISGLPEVTIMKPGNVPSVLTTVRVGPYPTIEEFNSESKFLILSRIMKSVNGSLVYLSSDVVSRHVCLATLSICESGFTFPETNFVSKVMESDNSCEVVEDHSKKPRQHVNSALLLELLTGVYMALFNGAPDLALRAIDAMHQRAQYEILAEVILLLTGVYMALFNGAPDLALRAIDAMHQRAQYEILAEVILVTSAIRNSLLENPLSKEKRDELMFGRTHNPSNAFAGMDNLKRKVSALGLHHKIQRRRKNSIDPEDVELQTIREEKFSDGDANLRLDEISESPHFSNRVVVEVPFNMESNGKDDHHAKHHRHINDEEKKEDRCRNGTTEKEKDHLDSPIVERPEQLCGEQRFSSSDDSGTYTVGGLRHMDSGSSTQRSFDY
ncbi:hypothetical protein COOONC_08314 [Cooperia oncophora]